MALPQVEVTLMRQAARFQNDLAEKITPRPIIAGGKITQEVQISLLVQFLSIYELQSHFSLSVKVHLFFPVHNSG